MLNPALCVSSCVPRLFIRHIFAARFTLLGLFFLLLSLQLAAPASAQVNVLTQHNDNARTGQNLSEATLTPSNVNSTQFGKLFSVSTDGQIYAQPLYVANLAIPGKGSHNVVFVATEADSVYAFDADTSGPALWHASLVDSAHGAGAGETALNSSSTIGCGDLKPLIGITSTPVIDLSSGTIYVEAKSVVGTTTTYIHRLHALDITTGAEKSSSPVVITATVNGTGTGSSGGKITFDPLYQHSRPGLTLVNGTVFIAYASHCDQGPYHGWVFAYDHSTLQQKAVFNATPNGTTGGFWMSGAGIAADSSGTMYIASGNGSFSQTTPLVLGDSIIKLAYNGNFSVSDYFTPSNQNSLNGNDEDLGSGGVLLLPDQPGAHPHLLVEAGKEGRIYVVDRDLMTTGSQHYCNGCGSDPEIVQESASGQIGGLFSAPAYWNNTTYWMANSLKAIPISSGKLNFAQETSSSDSYGFPGATPSISSNGNSNGIVWSVDTSQYGAPGTAVLHAHNASNVSQELYNSSQAANHRDVAGNAVKFAVPTIANGKVFLGAWGELDVYGLLSTTPTAATPSITPVAGTYSNSVTVSITDSTPSSTIYYTTNNSTPTTSSTKYTGSFGLTSSATVKAIATASGFLTSNVASNTYAVTTGNKTPIVYQTESLPAVSSGPTHRVFAWSGFTNGEGSILDASKVGDNVTYTVNIATAATYDVKVGVKKYETRGIWQLFVNGKNLGSTEDEFSGSQVFAEYDLGTVTISATGNSSFKFTIVGRNASSSGYTEAFDYIKLTPQ